MKNFKKVILMLSLCLAFCLMASNVFANQNNLEKKYLPKGKIGDILKKDKTDKSIKILTSDLYEPNDYIDTAKRMPSDTINANIGYEGDWDCYLHYFEAGSRIKVTLTGIPVGCDYDIYLCLNDAEGTILERSINADNQDEYLKFNIAASGDYLVVVMPYIGFNDSQDYTLYAGTRIIHGSGNLYYDLPALYLYYPNEYSSSDNIDLRYYPVPNEAKITSMYLYGDITGQCAGITKEVYCQEFGWTQPNYSGRATQVEGASLKQIWSYHWKAQYLYQYTIYWTPKILINYEYFYDPDPIQ